MMERTDTSTFDRESDPSRQAARLVVEEGDRPPRSVLVVPGMTVRIGRADDLELSLDDPRVSRVHAVFRYDGRAASLQDLGSSNGTWINDQRVNGSVAAPSGTVLRVGSTSIAVLLPESTVRNLPTEEVDTPSWVVAEDPATVSLFALARRLASSELPVLIQGETGSGKEVIARELHGQSARHAAPFIAINCAMLSDALTESELYGFDRGSNPDGVGRKIGALDAAHGGTLLLDEVGELSGASQARLLHVLQERVFVRPGVSKAYAVDVRVLATSRRELPKEVSAGRFREDLYFRLNGATLEVPPLRARPRDVLPIAQRVLQEHPGNLTLGPGVAAVLGAHRWPGNVRELRNAMESAAALAQGGVLRPEHLPPAVRGEFSTGGEGAPSALREQVDETERKVIVSALESTGWNQSRAARALGISRRALIYKMERYGLKPLPGGPRHV